MRFIGWIIIGALVGVAGALLGGMRRTGGSSACRSGPSAASSGGWVADTLELADAQAPLDLEGAVAALMGAATMIGGISHRARPL